MRVRKFRFEDLEIWKEAILIANIFFDIADDLEERKLWRFADQCRGVGMGITNNIAESTGSIMVGEQQQFLRYSKRECFEGANIPIILYMRALVTEKLKESLFERLEILSRRIESYSRSLK